MRALTFGLGGGGVVVALMALVYFQSPSTFLSPVFQWSLVIVYLVAMVGVLLRRPPYKRLEAIRAAVVVYMLVSASYYVYTYALYEVFDPTLYELQSELMIENAQRFQTGTPGRAAEAPEVVYAPERLRYTLGGIAYNYVFGLLSGVAVAFLLGNLLGVKSDDAATSDTVGA